MHFIVSSMGRNTTLLPVQSAIFVFIARFPPGSQPPSIPTTFAVGAEGEGEGEGEGDREVGGEEEA